MREVETVDHLLTAEEVTLQLKVGKDWVWDHSSQVIRHSSKPRSKFIIEMQSSCPFCAGPDLFIAKAWCTRVRPHRHLQEDLKRAPAIVGVHVELSVPEFSRMYTLF